MAGDNWYYSIGGQQTGPVAAGRLRELANAGQLTPTDLVWKEGAPNWVPASTVKGLFAAAGASGIGLATPAPTPNAAPQTVFAASGGSPYNAAAADFSRQAKAAGQDAMTAFKILVTNPIGGIHAAYETLGEQRAMLVGIVFSVLFYLLYVLAFAIETSFAGKLIWRFMILGFIPPLGLIGGCALVRTIFKSAAKLSADVFLAGVSLVPVALLIFLGAILQSALNKVFGAFSLELEKTAEIFVTSIVVLMLYSGCTKIYSISERASALAVPIIIAVSFCAHSMIGRAIMPSFEDSFRDRMQSIQHDMPKF